MGQGVPYQEGMPVYIRDGVAIDPWGRQYEGYDVEDDEAKAAAATETVQEPDREDDRYDEMSADELKEELKSRHEAGRQIDTTGVRRKAELAQLLREDDAAQAREQQG